MTPYDVEYACVCVRISGWFKIDDASKKHDARHRISGKINKEYILTVGIYRRPSQEETTLW